MMMSNIQRQHHHGLKHPLKRLERDFISNNHQQRYDQTDEMFRFSTVAAFFQSTCTPLTDIKVLKAPKFNKFFDYPIEILFACHTTDPLVCSAKSTTIHSATTAENEETVDRFANCELIIRKNGQSEILKPRVENQLSSTTIAETISENNDVRKYNNNDTLSILASSVSSIIPRMAMKKPITKRPRKARNYRANKINQTLNSLAHHHNPINEYVTDNNCSYRPLFHQTEHPQQQKLMNYDFGAFSSPKNLSTTNNQRDFPISELYSNYKSFGNVNYFQQPSPIQNCLPMPPPLFQHHSQSFDCSNYFRF